MKNEKFEYDTFYHFYNRGNNKEDIFIEERNLIMKKNRYIYLDINKQIDINRMNIY